MSRLTTRPCWPASRQYTVALQIFARIDLLVRHVRWHVDEIAGPGLGEELQPLAPTQARDALDDADDAFEVAMVVRLCLGVRIDRHGARP